MPLSAAPALRRTSVPLPEGVVAVAQLNVARPRYPLDNPRMAGFVDALDTVNAIAERSDGFLWRLRGNGNHALDVLFDPEPDAIVNMSVWRDVDALQRFVWTTVHRRFVGRKLEWFNAAPRRDFVMWWVDPAHQPSLSEGAERLTFLRREGSTDFAFGWDHVPPMRWLGRIADDTESDTAPAAAVMGSSDR